MLRAPMTRLVHPFSRLAWLEARPDVYVPVIAIAIALAAAIGWERQIARRVQRSAGLGVPKKGESLPGG